LTSSSSLTSSNAVKQLLQIFLRRGFKYLSLCRGGYAACHALILASDHSLELVDHNQQECLECTGRRKVKEKKISFMANVRRLAGTLSGKVEQEAVESVEEFEAEHIPDSAVILLPPSLLALALGVTAVAAPAAHGAA
jgi:hypothetical protein